MHVKHTDEQGHLDIAVENENIKVTYTVDREHKEISKGIMGAIAGAGIGGVIGNILSKNQSAGDAITGAVGGAAAGGGLSGVPGQGRVQERADRICWRTRGNDKRSRR